jgi:uncharacterized membrane protein YfcA
MIKMLFMLSVIYIAYRMFFGSNRERVDGPPRRNNIVHNNPPSRHEEPSPRKGEREDYIDYEELK